MRNPRQGRARQASRSILRAAILLAVLGGALLLPRGRQARYAGGVHADGRPYGRN